MDVLVTATVTGNPGHTIRLGHIFHESSPVQGPLPPRSITFPGPALVTPTPPGRGAAVAHAAAPPRDANADPSPSSHSSGARPTPKPSLQPSTFPADAEAVRAAVAAVGPAPDSASTASGIAACAQAAAAVSTQAAAAGAAKAVRAAAAEAGRGGYAAAAADNGGEGGTGASCGGACGLAVSSAVVGRDDTPQFTGVPTELVRSEGESDARGQVPPMGKFVGESRDALHRNGPRDMTDEAVRKRRRERQTPPVQRRTPKHKANRAAKRPKRMHVVQGDGAQARRGGRAGRGLGLWASPECDLGISSDISSDSSDSGSGMSHDGGEGGADQEATGAGAVGAAGGLGQALGTSEGMGRCDAAHQSPPRGARGSGAQGPYASPEQGWGKSFFSQVDYSPLDSRFTGRVSTRPLAPLLPDGFDWLNAHLGAPHTQNSPPGHSPCGAAPGHASALLQRVSEFACARTNPKSAELGDRATVGGGHVRMVQHARAPYVYTVNDHDLEPQSLSQLDADAIEAERLQLAEYECLE